MQISLLKAQIHRATVTDANPEYIGSLTIDSFLMEALNIIRHEQVHVWDINNGNRLVTYAMEGPEHSGVMCVNGAGARLISPGDLIIVATFANMTKLEAKEHKPKIAIIKSPENTEFLLMEEDAE
jgi:aspartate 1-decarboxylase